MISRITTPNSCTDRDSSPPITRLRLCLRLLLRRVLTSPGIYFRHSNHVTNCFLLSPISAEPRLSGAGFFRNSTTPPAFFPAKSQAGRRCCKAATSSADQRKKRHAGPDNGRENKESEVYSMVQFAAVKRHSTTPKVELSCPSICPSASSSKFEHPSLSSITRCWRDPWVPQLSRPLRCAELKDLCGHALELPVPHKAIPFLASMSAWGQVSD
jgi:hypothetical protein